MTDDELKTIIELTRENERMRTALSAMEDYARRATMGIWRQTVSDMAQLGLGK